MIEHKSQIAQLSIWTKKFAPAFSHLNHSILQKISASDKGELILNTYKINQNKNFTILSVKKGDSGISLSKIKPVTLNTPNSFLQITRKYLLNRRILCAYASISPICIIIEFENYSTNSNEKDKDKENLNEGPKALILDLDTKPPRLILAKKTDQVPSRYEKECGENFKCGSAFFESWCEWSQENTKTKKRAAFYYPFVGYCPFIPHAELTLQILNSNEKTSPLIELVAKKESALNILDKEELSDEFDVNAALGTLPTHIRKHVRTKLQFLERRLHRQKFDLPTDKQLSRLKVQSENLKNVLYLWPINSLIWYVPPQFIEEYQLNPIYTLKKDEKPSSILKNIFHEIHVLERRKGELAKRILESETELLFLQNLIFECSKELKNEINQFILSKPNAPELKNNLKTTIEIILTQKKLKTFQKLSQYLNINLIDSPQAQKIKQEKAQKSPFRNYVASTGQFIRVARSSADSELMLKKMPSNHSWLHVLNGEGSHVWLEKNKGDKKQNQQALLEAGILAVHFSKHSRAQNAEVQFAQRKDIEKKKNLPPGKVLVRRCETFLIRYESDQLSRIINLGVQHFND